MIPGRLLNQFIAVAEEMHFGRAAARLHMAQPPLSQAIKNLEEMVGVQLFARSKHAVALTPAGRAFLDEARELIAQGQRAIDIARRASEGLTGRIAIGFMGSVSYELLPRILREFRTRFPAIHVDLREQTSVEQIESLHAGKLDLGLVRVPLVNAADLNMRTIEVERFIAVLPRDHRLAASRSLRLEDLAEAPFMIFPADKSPSLHAKFLLACDDAGFSPRIAHEAWQMASMVSLVAAGMGVALLPAQVRNSPHPGVVYKDLENDSEHLELKIAAAWRGDNLSAGVHSLLSVLEEH
ncbi:LysR family transcriptional regulator [Paraburkholderia sp. PGU19]|uniref:LysR family transcriptional regulator n=1 Tax=Paraburkholderia sp. PGU19 TaxID=2735434 RepID=UPI0015D9D3C8|nr:LysR family transcriptional regulator [Paraburkholderia sp. PGU19]BCG01257.1 LysR family transcriptional regulator [Paraburkholderia sp. PGU19]